MYKLFIIITVTLVIIKSSSQKSFNKRHHHNVKGLLEKCHGVRSSENVEVFVTVSSLALSTNPDGTISRHLEINWLGRSHQKGDAVAIYDADPRSKEAVVLYSADPSAYPGGFIRTSVRLSFLFFNIRQLSLDPCLGFWAAYTDLNGNVLDTSCLQTRPFWMENISPYLASKTLDEIMIPGSHDSGSFHCGPETAPLSRYKFAQEEPIFNQLVYGLRYFDLRVGYYNNTKEKFFVNHNFLRTEHTIESVLQQVLKFIKATKKEIVILDFHNFPIGFHNEKIHLILMQMIVKTFGSLMVPFEEPDQKPTLGYLWQKQKRILVSYNSPHRTLMQQKLLWPGIIRAWGNKQHPQDLKKYFEVTFSRELPKAIWAAMAELTPNARTILLHPASGLRVFADEINRNVTRWFRDLYWQKANIVATDYFMGNNIIDVAIDTNVLKAHCSQIINSTAVNLI